MGKFGDWLSDSSGGIIGSLIATIGNGIISKKTNEANAKQQEAANKTNIQLQEMANTAQAQENEKAYNRSKATNQVALLQDAGMSKAGAINSLAQGGAYTPAAVNAAQVQASQQDNSGLMSAMQQFANVGQQIDARKQEYKMFQQAQAFEREKFEQQKKESEARIKSQNLKDTQQDLENQLKANDLEYQTKIWPEFMQWVDSKNERFDTATDLRFALQNDNPELYKRVMTAVNAVALIDSFMSNQSAQRKANSEANIAEMTEEDVIQMVRDDRYISANNKTLSDKEIEKVGKVIYSLELANDYAKIRNFMAEETKDSTITSTNAVNLATAADATLQMMMKIEDTEAFKRMDKFDKQQWADARAKLQYISDERGAFKADTFTKEQFVNGKNIVGKAIDLVTREIVLSATKGF